MATHPIVRSLTDAAVVIAGGTSGVGLASAHAFVDAGVRRIALLARNKARGDEAREAVLARCPDATVEFIPVDASSAADAVTAIDTAHQRLGAIDVLVNSVASTYRPELLVHTPIEHIAEILDQQALPPMYLSHAALPIMAAQHGGSIINIASDAAKTATPGETVLGASMAAIVMFSRTLAMEAKRDGIRVNAITPSLIAGTPTADRVTQNGFSQRLFEKAAKQAHLGVAEPDDLAGLVVFLGGPESARLTGQAISVNGGISAA
jgi:NAD(P)-dependent dehydrogenase (short-subunit alcohol dehydrogenase family)